MIVRIFFLCLLHIVLLSRSNAQIFFRTGNPENINRIPEFGLLLAGGGEDHNLAMAWLVGLAKGGDVVVLRATGSDGYNDYIFAELGVQVNSVTTIIVGNATHANAPHVCEAVANAELVFIAGGNQWHYYNHWKGSCLQQVLNDHVNVKKAPIGGTSAGLAVLGEVVYTGQKNSALSLEVLKNPYHGDVTLARDFLQIPFLQGVVTDSHYADRERQGRHVVFMARMNQDWGLVPRGIGVDEGVAVAVDKFGMARVFGYSYFNHAAYFIWAHTSPELCAPEISLQWSHQQNALKVYRIAGHNLGLNEFSLRDWSSGSGGEWNTWYVQNGLWYGKRNQQVGVVLQILDSATQLPLEGVTVSLNGYETKITDLAGEVLFEQVSANSRLGFTLNYADYPQQSGVLDMGVSNLSEQILLLPNSRYVNQELFKDSALKVFPNPAHEVVFIHLKPELGMTLFELLSFDGRKMLEKNLLGHEFPLRLEIGNLPPGYYLIRIGGSKGVITRKLIKM